MIGVYLAAFRADHSPYPIIYQDINGKRDLGGDMMDVDLDNYDFVIATPPCNYWSRANYRRDRSSYALNTRHLLPSILNKLCKLDKPFIVENVRNDRLFKKFGLYDYPCFIYKIGRHTYWTNIMMSVDIPQRQDFLNGGYVIKYDDMKDKSHQGGQNVHNVIDSWLSLVEVYLRE